MEFKIIIYFLIAIGWYVMNNYKKIAEENRKRTFNKPVEYAPAEEMPTIPDNPQKKVEGKSSTMTHVKKRIPQKKLAERKQRPEIIIPEFEFSESMLNPIKEIQQEKPAERPQLQYSFILHDKKTMINAIVLGEILNKPCWSKY